MKPSSNADNKPSPAPIVAALILIGSLVYYLSYLRYGIVQVDEGLILDPAERMIRGERWWVDFYVPYGPLRFWFLAKLFAITGAGFAAYRLYFIFLRLVGIYLMFSVSRRLMPSKWAVFAVLPAVVVPSHIFKSDLLLFQMLVLWVLYRCYESERYLWPLVAGAVAGFSYWFRSEFLVVFSAIMICGLEVGHLSDASGMGRRFIRRALLIVGICAGFGVLVPFFPGVKMALQVWGRFVVTGMTLNLGVPWPGISSILSGGDTAAAALVFNITLLLFLTAAIEVAIGLFRTRSSIVWKYRSMVLAVAIATTYNAVYQSNLSHLLQVLAPAYILLADAGHRVAAHVRGRIARYAAALVSCGLLAALSGYGMFFSNVQDVGGIAMRRLMKVPIKSPLGVVYYLTPRAEYIQSVVDYLRTNTGPDDQVAVLPLSILISVMAQRRNPNILVPATPQFLQHLGSTVVERFYNSVMEADVIVYFERPTHLEHPRARQQRFRYSYPFLYELILRNYTFEKLLGDYVVFRRGPDKTGATREFVEGWEAYKYGDYQKARRLLDESIRLGAPSGEIAPIFERMERGIGPDQPLD